MYLLVSVEIEVGAGPRAAMSAALPPRRQRAVVAAGAIAGALLLWFFDPRTAGFYPPCPSFYLTGLQCPGCGTTRALHALVHGNPAGAWRLNPLTMTLLVLVAAKLVTPPLPPRALGPLAALLFITGVVFAVVRNLP